MSIDIVFINGRKFTALLFSGLFFIGLGYIFLLPVFEGFDETAHYSRIREIRGSTLSVLKQESYIDQVIVNYSGPQSYSSGYPPFSHQNTYDNFFNQKNLVDGYQDKYSHKPLNSEFIPSDQINWQIQHPPLYYFLFSALNFLSENLSLTSQFFTLRFFSYILAISGVFLGFIALHHFIGYGDQIKIANMRLGFLIYPIIFPMFFLEFARIGNDSLCILLVGVMTYLMSRWSNKKNNSLIALAIGLTLALGLITKALFMPIVAAIGLVLLVSILRRKNQMIRLELFKGAFLIFLPICLIGGGWYLFKYFMVGDPGLGYESFKLAQQGGLVNGLKNHFDFIAFIRGLIVPLVTFIWAGTWSLVRMPLLSYIPLLVMAAWLLWSYILLEKDARVLNLTSILVPSFLFMYLGLAWHVMIMIGLNEVGTSPGWYFHILMPLIAPLIGVALSRIGNHILKVRLFISLLIYCHIFHLSAILLHASLFGAGATKGDSKAFVFSNQTPALNWILKVYDNLTIISFPKLSVFSFALGFLLLGFLLYKALLKPSLLMKSPTYQ